MNYFFLRFIPYLFYFIRDQYRRDVSGPAPNKEKRFKYRTVIAILLSVLILLSFAGIVKYRQLNQKITDLNSTTQDTQGSVEKIANHQSNLSHGQISRDRYEADVSQLVYEKTRLDYEADFLAADLNRLCQKYPADCDDDVRHIIAKHLDEKQKP